MITGVWMPVLSYALGICLGCSVLSIVWMIKDSTNKELNFRVAMLGLGVCILLVRTMLK